jgi:hypothetical protein
MSKNHDLDEEYIEKWLREFDALSEEKEFLTVFRDISGTI